MFKALRAVLVAVLFAGAAMAAEVKPYGNEDLASDAVRLAETLKVAAGKVGAQTAGRSPEDLRRAAVAATAASKFDAAAGLAAALDRICQETTDAVLSGNNILILSDRATAQLRDLGDLGLGENPIRYNCPIAAEHARWCAARGGEDRGGAAALDRIQFAGEQSPNEPGIVLHH